MIDPDDCLVRRLQLLGHPVAEALSGPVGAGVSILLLRNFIRVRGENANRRGSACRFAAARVIDADVAFEQGHVG